MHTPTNHIFCNNKKQNTTNITKQVMVQPVGKPGLNPEKDVSVPINWAYNRALSCRMYAIWISDWS